MPVFTVLMVKTNHYNGKDTLFGIEQTFYKIYAHFCLHNVVSSCTDDKNNLEQLFDFSTKVIGHTVKTSNCCDILFVTSNFTLILHLFVSINQILFTSRKK